MPLTWATLTLGLAVALGVGILAAGSAGLAGRPGQHRRGLAEGGVVFTFEFLVFCFEK